MELADVLAERGYRVSRPRDVVWHVLSDHHRNRHLSASEVATEVCAHDPGINVSSVYRTLALFAELGLVRESRSGDQTATTWEIAHADADIHLVCTACGRVRHHRTALVDQLADELAAVDGFVPTDIDVRVHGRCTTC